MSQRADDILRAAPHRRRPARAARRGTAAMLAMLYLAILGTLALAMYATSTTNVQAAYNMSDVAKARAVAESGLRWQAYRFENTVKLPIRLEGKITPDVALAAWPALRDALRTDYAAVRPQPAVTVVDTATVRTVRAAGVRVDDGGAEFDIEARLILSDPPILRVVSTGRYRGSSRTAGTSRSAWMDFLVTKKIRYAVVGRVPIQLGRNTLIEGAMGMTTANKPPPALVLGDFKHLNSQLAGQVDSWYALLKQVRPSKYDNRISVNNVVEYNKARAAGYTDTTGDGYVDEFDLFVKYYDKDRDGRVHLDTEFRDTSGKPFDENLFAGIDGLGALKGEDTNGNGLLDAGEDADEDGLLDQRLGYRDGFLDADDEYAKIRGEITLAPTLSTWQSSIGTQKIQDVMQGPIVHGESPGEDPVTLGSAGKFAPDPATFAGASAEFEKRSGANAGTPIRAQGIIANTDLLASDVQYSPPHVKVTVIGKTGFKLNQIVLKTTFDATNAALAAADRGTAVAAPTTADERTPYGSTSWQATYRRPVYRRIRFTNVRIPKGINGLFEHCTFEGVTFVEMTKDITYNGKVTYDKNEARTWSQSMKSGSFSNTTVLTPTNSNGAALGNNLRFDNCTMEGPIASSYSTAYSHFTNSWEFTGATMFDNKVDETATIVAPQTNIEMGSFTTGKDPSTLVGVVVAGNIDIRGTSVVDGSIIVTGDGAGNTTLGYFGASDGDTNPGAMPEGGYGRLDVRYNEHRALPDGVNIPLMLLAKPRTYDEGMPPL